MSQHQPVLIVEDDEDIRETLEQALQDEGLCVLTASDGKAAVDLLGSLDKLPCIMLLDLMMPRMNGHDVLANLQRRGALQALKVLVITADHSASQRLPPEVRLMKKPVNLDAVLAAVNECCVQPRA